ncbi:Rho GTPase-activating protein 7 [Chionoecetes opilio]|uniref:Rho GTPase-activating protein 7 n=1 Tax=Chionoecetes opilio TaxID=41210 RepID=A0A8J4YFS5_CHIOP|nr:Rho GTPase-activating protein 7 [Chionoecetes opilio]
MYEELQFPLDLGSVERDHSFLERDSLQALFRRLSALNRCARIRLDSARKNKAEDSDDDEVAISDNWRYQRPSRRWSRIVHDRSSPSGGGGESQGLEVPDDALLAQFKRSGSERLKDGAKAFLKRMESLKNKKKKRNREGVVISSPKLLDEAVMREKVGRLGCVDLPTEASPMLTFPCHHHHHHHPFCHILSFHHHHHLHLDHHHQRAVGRGKTDSSDHSQGSTPLSRARRRHRLPRRGAAGAGEAGGGSGAHSDSEYSPQTWRHHYLTDANSNTMDTPGPASASSPKHQRGGKGIGAGGHGAKAGQVRHTGSLNYGKDSHSVREHFLASIRGGVDKASAEEQASPPSSPSEDRHSVYDNVPLIICNKVYRNYQPEGLDSETSVPESSGSSESRDSPLPSTHDDEDNDDSTSRGRATVERWHSFNRRSHQPVARQLGTQINGFSSGQMLHLRKRALLRLTALMERYCPSNRSGWNWELPKFMRKMKTPDYRERQVFGVPLQVVAQRTGQPLPPCIQAALQYLRSTSLDQVGIFRKPGVRSRIQKLRELHEGGDDVIYSSFSTCDIADMVKTYFRELPEVLLTNKLSEMFIAIFQYLPNEHRLEALQCAVLMLPDENREVLMALLTFLADVAANAPLNQMTASNLAVCLAPSLFHLNVGGSSGSSPLRRRPGSAPEQKDLHENMAAHQCLSLMILQVSQLQCVPMEMLSNCRFTYLEQSQPVSLDDLGMGSPGGTINEGDWNSYMTACITSLFKEARDKSRGWVSMNCGEHDVEVLYRKVGDGHPLRLWRATTEVEAPPAELLNRVIRERHLWDDSLFKWRVVCSMDRQSEVFLYMCNSMPPRPPVDYCVLSVGRSHQVALLFPRETHQQEHMSCNLNRRRHNHRDFLYPWLPQSGRLIRTRLGGRPPARPFLPFTPLASAANQARQALPDTFPSNSNGPRRPEWPQNAAARRWGDEGEAGRRGEERRSAGTGGAPALQPGVPPRNPPSTPSGSHGCSVDSTMPSAPSIFLVSVQGTLVSVLRARRTRSTATTSAGASLGSSDEYVASRHWRNDLTRGSCVVVETSVEHSDAPVLVGGVRGIVLASRYLIQPCGSGKSRITHISRVDMRGRTPEWYNKIYGHVAATHLKHIRQSFQHHAAGPESKV